MVRCYLSFYHTIASMPILNKTTGKYIEAVYCIKHKTVLNEHKNLDKNLLYHARAAYKEHLSIFNIFNLYMHHGDLTYKNYKKYNLIKIINNNPLEYIILTDENFANELDRYKRLVNLK